MKARDTQGMMDDQAEHDLMVGNAAAYARAMELDPEFRSVSSQPLPDRYYRHAQGHVARGRWTQAQATAYLQAQIHSRAMVARAADSRAERMAQLGDGTLMHRADAALHTLIKSGGMCALALLCLWGVTDPVNVALVTPLALALVAFRVCAAALTRSVL